jgi:hypothetical protein
LKNSSRLTTGNVSIPNPTHNLFFLEYGKMGEKVEEARIGEAVLEVQLNVLLEVGSDFWAVSNSVPCFL